MVRCVGWRSGEQLARGLRQADLAQMDTFSGFVEKAFGPDVTGQEGSPLEPGTILEEGHQM